MRHARRDTRSTRDPGGPNGSNGLNDPNGVIPNEVRDLCSGGQIPHFVRDDNFTGMKISSR